MNEKGLSARVTSPGQILTMELAERGWTQNDLAEIMGLPALELSEVVTGKKQITPDIALEFGAAFGTSAEFWLNLEDRYRGQLAKTQVHARR